MRSNSTADKQAEEELRIAIAAQKESLRRAQRSELRYKTLIEYAADALFVFNLDGRFVEVNQQACDSLGYTCEELLRMGIAEVAPGHDLAGRRAVWATLEPGKRYSVTATHRRKDGSTFPVEIHLAALLADDQKLMMALVSDISERKQAEQRMQEQQDRLNLLIDSAMDAVISTDENQNITIFNHAAEQMFGYRAADIIGQPLGRLMPPKFRAKHRQQMDDYGRNGITTRTLNTPGVVYGLRANGEEFPSEASISQVEVAGKKIYTAILRDVSKRIQADAEIEKSGALLRSIIETSPVRIFWKDRESRYLGCNALFAQDAGLPGSEQIIGKDDYQLAWKDQADLYRTDDRKVMDSDTPKLDYDEHQTTPDGRTLCLRTSKVPMHDADGKVIGVLGVYDDVTEHIAAEAKIKRMSDLYAVLGQCNQAIVRCTSEDELFPQICRDAVQFGGMKMAWIGLVDEASRMVNPVAAFGVGTEYLDGIKISVDAGDPSGRGTTGTAIRENRPVWIQDFQNDPRLRPWHERGAYYGWGSVAALPLHRKDKVIGAMTLYDDTANVFDEPARNLLVEMAMDIDHALDSYMLQAERKRAEDELRIAAATFEIQQAILITDADGKIVRVNQGFQDITGYRADEVVGQNPRIFKSGVHDAAFYQAMWDVLLATGKWSGEVWDKRKSGEIYPKSMTITAVHGDQGQVTQYVAVFRDISKRKRTEQEIHQLAFFDPLTQLPNRRLLLDRLQQAMVVSRRSGRCGALLFLDMDNFKTINDTQGHAVGDLLLIEVARRLQSCVREGDSVARLGGDEFVVVLEELSSQLDEAASQAELVAEKIRNQLGEPYKLKNYECRTTPSIGISLFHGHVESVEDLLKHADVAMYQAKMAGRNAIRFFDPQMQLALETRMELEADLRSALTKLQFLLYYQVQVDSSGRATGAEALLRWEHPERGLVSPTEFIPLTEETGLIVPIGLWVLQTACAQLKAWQHDESARDVTLAVNVSAKQFRQADFTAQLQRVLLESGAKPSQLKLELTESTVLENVEDAIAKMREIKMLGVSFSLDDFGTGYSSLQYLKRLPLDQIKIDRSFVRDIASDPNDAAIVQAIIAMTDALGLNVIAEGVETGAQLDFLDKHGCHAFQGYLFGKPVPIEEFEALLGKPSHRN